MISPNVVKGMVFTKLYEKILVKNKGYTIKSSVL